MLQQLDTLSHHEDVFDSTLPAMASDMREHRSCKTAFKGQPHDPANFGRLLTAATSHITFSRPNRGLARAQSLDGSHCYRPRLPAAPD